MLCLNPAVSTETSLTGRAPIQMLHACGKHLGVAASALVPTVSSACNLAGLDRLTTPLVDVWGSTRRCLSSKGGIVVGRHGYVWYMCHITLRTADDTKAASVCTCRLAALHLDVCAPSIEVVHLTLCAAANRVQLAASLQDTPPLCRWSLPAKAQTCRARFDSRTTQLSTPSSCSKNVS